MAKPILTIGIYYNYEFSKEINEQTLNNVINNLCDDINKDYHVLAYFTLSVEPKFNVFYEKDFNEAKYEEIKQFIQSEIDKIKPCKQTN